VPLYHALIAALQKIEANFSAALRKIGVADNIVLDVASIESHLHISKDLAISLQTKFFEPLKEVRNYYN
jgi:hypothetical protein